MVTRPVYTDIVPTDEEAIELEQEALERAYLEFQIETRFRLERNGFVTVANYGSSYYA